MSEWGEGSESSEASEASGTAETGSADIDNAEKNIDTSGDHGETGEKGPEESAESANLKEIYGDTTETKENDDGTIDEDIGFRENIGLTDEQKAEVQSETGWSDMIVDSIRSPEEAEIYENAGLTESEVGGKKCLIKEDLEFDVPDEFGVTNRERINDGHSPHNLEGETIYVHHIGQHADSSLAELTLSEHIQGGNDSILHDKSVKSEVHGNGSRWSTERKEYWEQRLEENDDSKEDRR